MTTVVLLLLTLAVLVLAARTVTDVLLIIAPTGGARSPLLRPRAVLHRLTEPVLAPVRRVLPPVRVGPVLTVDLAPVVVLLGLLVAHVLVPR